MTKSELVAGMAADSGLTKADAEKALNAFLGQVEKALKQGDKVQLVGFGCVRPRFGPQPSGNPENLGTLGIIALSPSPVTGQKAALTTCLTTIGKFHNRV